MDLVEITDIKELKAMAYDQMAVMEQCQANLQAINERIRQVSQSEPASNGAAPIEAFAD
jgi:hypothetical protein